MFTKKEPLAVTYGIGVEEHDHEGRVITAEFEDYYVVTEKVIPFCKSKSSVNPFIGEDKFHII